MPSEPHHEHKLLKFPKDFLWGTATSAHQVEGNNQLNDWWAWEQTKEPHLRSGLADNEYALYEQDFDIAKSLAQNAHRLSIEWSRIEPTEGQFDQNEIDHYKKVLRSLKERDMQVMLTLWHVTLPKWLADKGGWESFSSAGYFERFVKKIVPELQEYVDFWITVNEPGIYAFMAYLGGSEIGPFPPAKKSNFSAIKATVNLARGHKKAYRVIHQLIPNAKVGMAQDVTSFEPFHKHSIIEQVTVGISDLITNHSFYFLTKGYHDFLGLNYYFHRRFNLKTGLIPELVNPEAEKQEVSDLGWEIYPEGLFEVLTDLSDGIPIYITECGIASTNDDRRTRFLIHYLQQVYQAIQAGVKVKGFFYWSLLDVFEWERAYEAKFGLVEVDFKTQARTIRPSAEVYGEIAQHNGIPHKLLKLLGHTLNVRKELTEMIKEHDL
ncbi:MAG: family 1 glycosylhydrolase [Candidatus Daviesbacteria bacterium]|nr:family 1 glycosylhydrolase [Candidatus Daviesbacteria bacterium]